MRSTYHAVGVYIIKAERFAYHQFRKELYIIKPQEIYTLVRDEIHRTLRGDVRIASLRASMPSLRLGQKKTKSFDLVFFGSPCPTRTNDSLLGLPSY